MIKILFYTFLVLLVSDSCRKDEKDIILNGYYAGSCTMNNGTMYELISFAEDIYVEFPSLGIINQQILCFSNGRYEIIGNTISFTPVSKTNCSGPGRLLRGNYNLLLKGDSLLMQKGVGDSLVTYNLHLVSYP